MDVANRRLNRRRTRAAEQVVGRQRVESMTRVATPSRASSSSAARASRRERDVPEGLPEMAVAVTVMATASL